MGNHGFLLGFEDGLINFQTWGNIWDQGLWRGEQELGQNIKGYWYEGHRKKITSISS